MATRTLGLTIQEATTTAGEGDKIDFYVSSGTNTAFGNHNPTSFSVTFNSSYLYADYSGSVTMEWKFRIKCNGTWYTLYEGSKSMSKSSSNFDCSGTLDSDVISALKSYPIDEVTVYQNGSRVIKGTSSATGTLQITYTEVNPSLTTPGTPTITQNNDGTLTAKWSAATGTNGSGSVYYNLWSLTDGYALSGDSTSTSVTIGIPSYNFAGEYRVRATYSGLETFSSSVTKTFYAPSIGTTTLTASATSGSSLTLTVTKPSLSYTTASTYTYYIYKNGTQVKSGTSTIFTFDESTLSGWGTSAVTLTAKCVASGLSNTYSGSTLTTASSNSVSFTYKASTTTCGAPTTVTVASNNVAPGATVTLSWSGASAGTNNAISGYEIYRSTSATGTYSKLTTVTSSATASSTNVTAPTTNGSSYYYKVLTVGSVSGYSSSQSTVYATLTCKFTAPTAPTTITIGGGTSTYAASGANVTLTWSGASAGTNNAITGYLVYRDGVSYTTTTSTSISVPAHATVGSKYTYTVYTKGTYSNSGVSSSCIVYTYGSPTAPTAVEVNNSMPDAGTSVTLSWSGAASGSYNSISGYIIYRATSSTGSYSKLTEVTTTASSGSCTVTAPSTMGASYYYKVYTKGARSNSSLSSTYAIVTAKTYTSCSAPTNLSFDITVSDGTVAILSWSGASGGTNNSITQYAVYLRESSDGNNWGDWQSHTVVETTNTYGSCNVIPPSTYGSYYQASVIVNGSAGEDYYSGREISSNMLRRNHAPFSDFTDSELISGTTYIKAVHMTELHDRINSLLEYYGLSKVSFSSIISNNTDLKDWTKHVTEIRDAIDLISTDHSDWHSITVNKPSAIVIQQIRDIVLSL